MERPLKQILYDIRLRSQSEFEKGEYFEKLVRVFLENDTLQGQTYDKVWLFKDWASERGLPSRAWPQKRSSTIIIVESTNWGRSSMQRVSIILPLYKSERYIHETVESVLAQTHLHWELIVVDDGSPDKSGDICRSFKDSRIKVFTRENTGPCRSRNFGIAQVTGDFIGFIDHDDIWLPEKLKKHLEHLNRRPEVGVSYGPSEFIDVNGDSLGLYQVPKLTGIDPREILCRDPIGNGSVPIIRRELFEATKFEVERDGRREVMYFDDEAARWEDVELWVRMATQTDWLFEGIPECLTLYRIVPDSIAGTPDTKQAAFENGLERMRRYAPELVEQHGAAARAYHLRYLARRLIEAGNGVGAVCYINQALKCFLGIFLEDPRRTLITLSAAYALFLLPRLIYKPMKYTAVALLGRQQKRQLK